MNDSWDIFYFRSYSIATCDYDLATTIMAVSNSRLSVQRPAFWRHSTGKERDAETGLDYFGARYFSAPQGRFTSPDPVTVTAARVIDPQQLNLYAYTRNNPLKYVDPTGMWIDTSELSDDDLEKWKKIKELANRKDGKGNYVNPNLHTAYSLLDTDERAFVIKNVKLSPSAAGEFKITEFAGNDFTRADIQLDFKKIENINTTTPADLVPGFNKFEGVLGNKTAKLAEVFGHEAGHAIFALGDTAEAVGLQMLQNDIDANLKTVRYPYPPDLMKKIEDARNRTMPTEQYSQQVEKLINGEIRAQDKRR